MKSLFIAVDFDGTCVTHNFPKIGFEIGAVPVLRQLNDAGHKLILWTMRSGEHLEAAEQWFRNHGITLYGIQSNPTQGEWTQSPKAYAHIYIDDAALGCPLSQADPVFSDRPFVDWDRVKSLLFSQGVLPCEKCNQLLSTDSLGGEYHCESCGLPTVHDPAANT